MSSLTHRQIKTNGVTLHVASQGSGVPVIFCHGFPGLWYSFRHQLPAVASAGWRALAPDQRGYGRSDRPDEPAVYDADYMMQDMLGLLDALGSRARCSSVTILAPSRYATSRCAIRSASRRS